MIQLGMFCLFTLMNINSTVFACLTSSLCCVFIIIGMYYYYYLFCDEHNFSRDIIIVVRKNLYLLPI